MLKIIEKENSFFLENNGKSYLEFIKNSHDYSSNILDNTPVVKNHEFHDLIKNSPLKDFELTCKVNEFAADDINFLLNLGFEFYGVEYNPDSEEINEVYTYHYKTEFLIKDSELEEILKKLEIK